MSYFKLDVSVLKDSIKNYKIKKMNYEEDLILLCNSLINVDSAWNDTNSRTFIQKVSDDKSKMLEYLHGVDLLFDELTLFINNVEISLSRLGYRNELKRIFFDDSQLVDIKKHLNNVILYLNNALEQINNYFLTSDFNDMSLIYTLKNQLTSSLSLVNTLISNIDVFIKTMLDNINASVKGINKIDGLNLKLDVICYNPKIVDLY